MYAFIVPLPCAAIAVPPALSIMRRLLLDITRKREVDKTGSIWERNLPTTTEPEWASGGLDA